MIFFLSLWVFYNDARETAVRNFFARALVNLAFFFFFVDLKPVYIRKNLCLFFSSYCQDVTTTSTFLRLPSVAKLNHAFNCRQTKVYLRWILPPFTEVFHCAYTINLKKFHFSIVKQNPGKHFRENTGLICNLGFSEMETRLSN